MGGLDTRSALDRGLDAALRHDRWVTLGSLAVVVVIAWLYLWHAATGMDQASMSMPGMPGMRAVPRAIDAMALVLTFVMWTVMMAGMMLPSAAPTVLLYGAMVRRNGARGTALPGVGIFASAYLLVWAGFSVAATLLQTLLEQASLLTPALAVASARVAALALIVAGVYQLTPLKQSCLGKCRNPLEFFLARWRAGPGGAFRMGLEHGAYCVGCCWALMLLLLVAGVMNLAWVALIAAFVLVEKLFPAARLVSRLASAALILSGLLLLAGI
ncbi:MAG: DUF2182 domain-containing protein [Betaproteobacteria bacterium]|nr:DUF2182 domain-containing protein [Betaproteobacteria bacterium]